jgi:hypothetical protein
MNVEVAPRYSPPLERSGSSTSYFNTQMFVIHHSEKEPKNDE